MKNLIGLFVLAAVTLSCGALETEEPVTDIRDVRLEYSKSADAARTKFDGKELTVLGTVTYRSTVNPSIRVGSKTDSDIPITVPDIECVFEESDVLFRNVEEGQVIKIKGVLKVSEDAIKMEPCNFVPF